LISKNSIYLGNIYKSKDGYAGAVFAINAPCPTIKANSGGNSQPMFITRKKNVIASSVKNNDEIVWLGNIYGEFSTGYAGTVFGVNGVCQTIKANSGGNTQPNIVVRYADRSNHLCE